MARALRSTDVQRLTEIFADPVTVAAMVDRLVHDAEVIVPKGDSDRLRGKQEEVLTGQTMRRHAEVSAGYS